VSGHRVCCAVATIALIVTFVAPGKDIILFAESCGDIPARKSVQIVFPAPSSNGPVNPLTVNPGVFDKASR
jgi:hypothetical protein